MGEFEQVEMGANRVYNGRVINCLGMGQISCYEDSLAIWLE